MPPRVLPTVTPATETSGPQLGSSSARQCDTYLATGVSLNEIPALHPTPPTGYLSRNLPQECQRRHTRSISHPFPSFFGSHSKSDRRPNGKSPKSIDMTQDEGLISSSMHVPRSLSRKSPSRNQGPGLRTGNCATCDSIVRWPRHLDVYRCTACLMINDLKPDSTSDTDVLSTSPSHRANNSHILQVRRKVLPLSLERTRSLIDQDITTFLREEIASLEANNTRPPSQRYNGQDQTRPRLAQSRNDSSFREKGAMSAPQRSAEALEKASSISTSRRSYTELLGQFSQIGIPHDEPAVMAPTTMEMSLLHNTRLPTTPYTTYHDSISDAKVPVFRQLEAYLIASLKNCDCLNASFLSVRPQPARASSEASILTGQVQKLDLQADHEDALFEFDAKTLLLGDIGENGLWWTGGRRHSQNKTARDNKRTNTTSDRKNLRFDWGAINQWYDAILSCGRSWKLHYSQFPVKDRTLSHLQEMKIDALLVEAQFHVQRTFLKAIENLLRRPGRFIKAQEHCRFLLILLANPLLYPQQKGLEAGKSSIEVQQATRHAPMPTSSSRASQVFTRQTTGRGGATGQHSGIIKRILGLISNLSPEIHQVFISWYCRLPEIQFQAMTELIGGFVSYRLSRQHGRKSSNTHDLTEGLIPNMSGPGAGTSAHLHAAIGVVGGRLTNKEVGDKPVTYEDDWQIKAAAKVMSLLFSANVHGRSSRPEDHRGSAQQRPQPFPEAAQHRAHKHTQLLPTSAFYNMLLDHADLIADFETWESRRGKFCFCQYPMFLSIWAKIRIMEYDARRQMEVKARDAFFTSILSRKAISQYLVFQVRRDCLVDDSLRSVSEVIGAGQEEIKKGLRIEFLGEEGVDAGGLRKEWFLLLVREVFDPDHGLFVYDEDSHYCYFNPHSFETSDQFFLVGVVLGLAIYNSTILDVALPPFAFRKLLASAPHHAGPNTTVPRPSLGHTLDDLAEWKPSLAKGLRQLLEYEGDVEKTFCRDFVVDVDRYGQIIHLPLCSNGEGRPVTNNNRKEFVDLYVRYMLDTAVARQYEPFKRGFFTVCGGNALSLFRPEEIELLVRGSDEPLDISSLRAVAVYDNWATPPTTSLEAPTVTWFWETFQRANSKLQRKLLTFITGSDRIPAMGATSLVIKIVCLGDDFYRFPSARTCFNMLGLYRYRSRQELELKLWRAVSDSEGFGLK